MQNTGVLFRKPKLMKKLFKLIVCTAAILALASCSLFGDDKPSREAERVRTIDVLPDSIKKKIVEQDAQMKDLVFKVDTLTAELNTVKKENAELNEKLNGIKNPQNALGYISLGSLILAVIAIILFIFKKGLNEQEVIAVTTDKLDSSQRIKDLQYHVNTLKNDFQRLSQGTQTKYSSAPSNIEYQIQKLERRLLEVESCINSQQYVPSPQQSSYGYSNYQQGTTEVPRAGYANINTGKYFTKILDSNQETCVFSIKLKNETQGEFSIISLDKIKSRNGWQEVVEYTGSIEDATSFKEVDKGICEKVDESTWEVTKPLKIRLFK